MACSCPSGSSIRARRKRMASSGTTRVSGIGWRGSGGARSWSRRPSGWWTSASPCSPASLAITGSGTSYLCLPKTLSTLGASILHIAPGAVDIALLASPSVSQQHGFVHAGAVAAIADTAAGYAALSLMPPGAGVLTTEFKINLVAPAAGERIVARGRVIKAGRTLILAQTEVFSETAREERLVALLTATLMTIEGRDGVVD